MSDIFPLVASPRLYIRVTNRETKVEIFENKEEATISVSNVLKAILILYLSFINEKLELFPTYYI